MRQLHSRSREGAGMRLRVLTLRMAATSLSLTRRVIWVCRQHDEGSGCGYR
jgi:hypothetical protein